MGARFRRILDNQAEMTNQPSLTDTVISPLIDNDIEDFVQILRQYWLQFYGKELNAGVEAGFRGLLSKWNTFLLSKKDNQPTCAIISWSIVLDIELFLSWWEKELGCSLETTEKDWIHRWIPRWNKFLQIHQGVPVVTRFGLLFTLVGLLLYVVDMVTDIVTAITYVFAGEYWKCIFTLILVYGSIMVQTVWKWHRDGIDKTRPFVGLQDLGLLLINWSGFRECWTLFRVERLLYTSSKTNAQLVLELQDRRRNVALLKITEGICEACPQAILQVYLLLNTLEGNLTLTSGFRIVSVMISLCSAGAAVFNWKKSDSILDNKEIPISEMVVLLAWAVPITASRLLSTGLLLVIHPYVGLGCIILHIVLYAVYLIIATEYCRTFEGALYACMVGIWFFMSPFNIIATFTYRVIPPVIHFVGNAAVTVTWALNTTLLCTHPVLYACIIIIDCTFFTTGIIFCVIYLKWC